MDNALEGQRRRDPEADTFFLGRSIIEDPEFNEQTVLHENINPSTSEASPGNKNVTPKLPNRTNVVLTANHLNTPPSNGLSPPTLDVAINAQPTENLCEAEVVTDRPRRMNKTTIVLAAFGISAIIAAMVVLGVCFSGDCGSKDSDKTPSILAAPPTNSPIFNPTSSPTAPPIDVLVEQVVFDFVRNITFSDLTELKVDGISPESRALTWIIQNDTLFNISVLLTLDSYANDNEVSRRVLQRYTLATLWFQEVDEVRNWTNTSGWLEVDNECEWYGVFCENGYVTEISFFSLATYLGNGFVGTIPPDIGLLSSLNVFFMGSNEITGTIPESIGNCTQLIAFVIPNCSVTGTIPSSFGQLSLMFYFDLWGNEIAGTIPDSLVSWTNMHTFAVQENLLSGSIPSFITLWRGLERFLVYKNQLSGTIPEEIGNLTSMTMFDVFTNRLTGSLPPSIGLMTALTEFLVTENMLTGTIPSSIGNWSLIEQASFGFNNFTGTIPSEICAHINNTTDRLTRDCNVDCTCCTGCVE